MKYPPLPKTVNAARGPVTVRMVAVVDTGPKDLGCWDHETRIVQIRTGMTGESQWATLFHEIFHVTLTDSGLANLFTAKELEALCDAAAVGRMRERFNA